MEATTSDQSAIAGHFRIERGAQATAAPGTTQPRNGNSRRAVYGGANVNREGVVTSCQTCSFIGNRATQDGGATYEDYGSHVSYTQTRFTGNSARHQGGTVYEISRASQLEATILDVDQSVFEKNKARAGSSIYNLDASTLTIKNSTYPANTVYSPSSSKSQ